MDIVLSVESWCLSSNIANIFILWKRRGFIAWQAKNLRIKRRTLSKAMILFRAMRAQEVSQYLGYHKISLPLTVKVGFRGFAYRKCYSLPDLMGASVGSCITLLDPQKPALWAVVLLFWGFRKRKVAELKLVTQLLSAWRIEL